MALAVDSEQASNVGFGVGSTPASPLTFSFTNTAGTVIYLIVGLGASGAGTATFGTVSYGGSAMTKVLEATTGGGATGGKIGLFRLLSPATGSNTVSIAFTIAGTSNAEVWAGATSFTGNDTSTPEAQTHSAQGSSATASDTLAGVTVGNVTLCGAGAGSDLTAQSQTLSWAKNVDGATSLGNGRASRSASSGSVTHNFTISGSDSWATVIVEIKAAGGASSKAISPAAITSTSAMSGTVQKLAAVKPAAITASSAMSGNVQALKQVKPAAITSTSAVSGTVTKLGTKAIVPAAITSTSTVSGVVVKLASVHPSAINATSFLSGTVSGGTGNANPLRTLMGIGT